MKKIRAFPDIDIRSLGRRFSSDPITYPKNFYFYASGRAAIYSMAKAISGGRKKTAYLPAFHCGVEVEAFRRAGFEVKFYPVKPNLNADLEGASHYDFEPGDVFFVVHYFGFPQPMDRIIPFCNERQLSLVEDCAHGLYSRIGKRLLGSYGDWSIFSLRKTLALPNGGGVIRNDSSLPLPVIGKRHFNPALVKSAIRSILDYEASVGSIFEAAATLLLRAYYCFVGINYQEAVAAEVAPDEFNPSFYDDDRFGYELGMSQISKFFLQPMSVGDIVGRRRRNYQLLHLRLRSRSDIEPLFPELQNGVCPLCLPVWVDSSDLSMIELKKRGVEGFVFGRHHHPILSRRDVKSTEKMRSGILGLPVHQNLSENDIEELARRIEDMKI
jgi:dTDP-4-amino-4,6-dideoxygalactose transaminase